MICPKCGANDMNSGKKSLLTLVLIALIAITLVACGSSPKTESAPQSKEETGGEDKEGNAEKTGEGDAALAELLDIMYETASTLEGLDEDAYASSEQMEELIAVLEDQADRADAVAGLPENVALARNQYYDTIIYAFIPIRDMSVLADIINSLGFDSLGAEGAFDDLETLYSQIQETEEMFEDVEVPEYFYEGWDRVEKTFSQFETVIEKLYLAQELDDPLRKAASANMVNRLGIKLDSELDTLIDNAIEDGYDVLDRNLNKAEEIQTELEELRGLSSEELANETIYSYEDPQTAYFTYQAEDTIYPSLYGTMDQIIYISAVTLEDTRDALIEVEIPGFTQKYSQSFTIYPTITPFYIKPPLLTGDLDLNSAKDAQLVVNIKESDGSIMDTQTFPIRIMSKYDMQWIDETYGENAQDNILCFLTPENHKIGELKRAAIESIEKITNGQLDSFTGYQGAADEDVLDQIYITYAQAAGLMNAMSEWGVKYNMDGFSMSGQDALQRVRFPEDVLNDKSGLCIETSLTIASALQSAEMHAMIVMPPGHAQVAVETWTGSGDYFLIETTVLPNKVNDFINYIAYLFDENGRVDISNNPETVRFLSQAEWEEYLEDCYVLDCDDSVAFGLTATTN